MNLRSPRPDRKSACRSVFDASMSSSSDRIPRKVGSDEVETAAAVTLMLVLGEAEEEGVPEPEPCRGGARDDERDTN